MNRNSSLGALQQAVPIGFVWQGIQGLGKAEDLMERTPSEGNFEISQALREVFNSN